jgi:hypothetical protein
MANRPDQFADCPCACSTISRERKPTNYLRVYEVIAIMRCEMAIEIPTHPLRAELQMCKAQPYNALAVSLTTSPRSALQEKAWWPYRGCMAGLTEFTSGAYELGRGLVNWRKKFQNQN